jgi:hypothetical protein
MKRFRSALLIPPMGLTSAINVRGTPSEQRTKETPETDLKNNRIWSNNHASCVPFTHQKKGTTTRRASTHAPFIHIRAPEHEQSPSATANPRQELRKEVCYYHSQTRLDILQCEVLCIAPAMYSEARSHACHDLKEGPKRRYDFVHVHICVVADVPVNLTDSQTMIDRTDRPAKCLGQLFGASACLGARIFSTHITCVHDPPTQLACIRRDVVRVVGFACDASRIRYHLCV